MGQNLPLPSKPHPSPRARSHTLLTLGALAAGLAAGALAHWLGNAWMLAVADYLDPIGNVWTGALRLLAVPLVICVLFTSIAGSGGGREVGRLSALSLATFIAILLGGAALALAATPLAISVLPLERGDSAPAAAATAESPAVPEKMPAAGHWLDAISPTDLSASFARGDLLPIVVITILFAIAATRIHGEPRRMLVGVLAAMTQAMFVILSWLIAVAPVAVFALAYSMAARTGTAAAGHLGVFVGILIVLLVVFTAAMYPLAMIVGRVGLREFAQAVASAQIVAASTRSSLASLPALLDGGARLGLPLTVNGFVLPLSVAVFKANRAISGTTKLLIMAHMYGVELAPMTVVVFVATILLLSFATPGIPGGALVTGAPPMLAAGMPMEGIALFYAVEALPDVFKTLANVTADMTSAAIVARFIGSGGTARESSPRAEAAAGST